MHSVRLFKRLLTNVGSSNAARRRKPMQCQPGGEQLEHRALQSGLQFGMGAVASPRPAPAVLVVPFNQTASDQMANDIKDQINGENDAMIGS
jgi:hypothetical protein